MQGPGRADSVEFVAIIAVWSSQGCWQTRSSLAAASLTDLKCWLCFRVSTGAEQGCWQTRVSMAPASRQGPAIGAPRQLQPGRAQCMPQEAALPWHPGCYQGDDFSPGAAVLHGSLDGSRHQGLSIAQQACSMPVWTPAAGHIPCL